MAEDTFAEVRAGIGAQADRLFKVGGLVVNRNVMESVAVFEILDPLEPDSRLHVTVRRELVGDEWYQVAKSIGVGDRLIVNGVPYTGSLNPTLLANTIMVKRIQNGEAAIAKLTGGRS